MGPYVFECGETTFIIVSLVLRNQTDQQITAWEFKFQKSQDLAFHFQIHMICSQISSHKTVLTIHLQQGTMKGAAPTMHCRNINSTQGKRNILLF